MNWREGGDLEREGCIGERGMNWREGGELEREGCIGRGG